MINFLDTVDELDVVAARVFGATILSVVLVGFAAIIFMVICWWKIYKKAGKGGWESLIPIYSNIVMLQITNNPVWLVILLFLPGVNAIGAPLYTILTAINLSKAFNKPDYFALLLIFVPVVGYPILAFGKNEYRLPEAIIK